MNNKYTSLELSKKLKENGCDLKSERAYFEVLITKNYSMCQIFENNPLKEKGNNVNIYQVYHILEDICVRYAKEFFGFENVKDKTNCIANKTAYKYHAMVILDFLQRGSDQERIEKYIWDNCLFNPNNKGEK